MFISFALLSLTATAEASVDPKCEGEVQKFDDEGQQNFMLNYFALSTSYSPLHGPVPMEEQTGGVGLELAVIPPLNCSQRLVLNSSKTEDTNKMPVLPRPRISYAFKKAGKVIPYASFSMLPPVRVAGMRNNLISGEIGFGRSLKKKGLEWGGRVHGTALKTTGEIATPFVEGDPEYLDLYVGNTWGADWMMGMVLGSGVSPYLSLGLLDASTFFYIGDDGYVANNTDPFFGPVASLGADYEYGNLTFAGEFHTVPGLTWTSPKLVEDNPNAGWHWTEGGYLYTARFMMTYRM